MVKQRRKKQKRAAFISVDKNAAFSGLKSAGSLSGGKQKKAKYTGFYVGTGQNQKYPPDKAYALKKSLDYPADDIAEVVTSSLLVDFIGEKQALEYRFTPSKDDGLYLESDKKKYFRDLAQDLRSNLKRKKGFFAHFPRWGWVFSNPATDRNRRNIYDCFKTQKHRQEMALVLAGCLLLNEYDCQVKNIAFCRENENEPDSVTKFDDGWGLAEICKPENQKVDLFQALAFRGDRATHKKSFVPTNHFMDYSYLLHTKDFANALATVANKALLDAPDSAEKALLKIDAAHAHDPVAHLQAYRNFAAHLGIELKDDNIPTIRHTIKNELTKTLKNRAESMKILSLALNLKIRIDNDPMIEIDKNDADCVQLIALLKAHEHPEDLLPDFSNAKKPFSKDKKIQAIYNELMDEVLLQAQDARVQAQAGHPMAAPQVQPKPILPGAKTSAHYPHYPSYPGYSSALSLPPQAKVIPQPDGSRVYAMDSTVSLSDQDALIARLCEQAVLDDLSKKAASPTPLLPLEFDLQNSPPAKKQFIQQTLMQFIENNRAHYNAQYPAPIIRDGQAIVYTLNATPSPVPPTPHFRKT